MSYSGFYHIICGAGHLTTADCYEYPNIYGSEGEGPAWICRCGARAIWFNNVDTTNGQFCYGDKEQINQETFEENEKCEGCEFCDKGRIDGFVELKVKELAVVKVCECCGESKRITETTYYIPEGGHKVE